MTVEVATEEMIHLVLLETSGNQAFIFATNRLAENMGASQLVWWSTSVNLIEAIERAPLAPLAGRQTVGFEEVHHFLFDPVRNPPLAPGRRYEVIAASSGKALILAADLEAAKELIAEVTRRVLVLAPGLALHGAAVELDLEAPGGIDRAVKAVHRRLNQVKMELPAPEARFLRLPVVAECGTSGLPAADFDELAPDLTVRKARSVVSSTKRRAAVTARNRLCGALESKGLELPRNLDELEKIEKRDWLAVVHADGNGVGQIFQKFGEVVERLPADGLPPHRHYIRSLRRFSVALDLCTLRAAREALQRMYSRGPITPLPVVPIVVGGDDLTVICDGRRAVRFAHDFLEHFEILSGQDLAMAPGAGPAERQCGDTIAKLSGGRLGSCAGIAVIKPHYPFHAAYELSEALLRSAKTGKKHLGGVPFTALDYHIHYESSGADLEIIRDLMTADGGKTLLTGRPYLVTEAPGVDTSTWGGEHHWRHLKAAVDLLVGQRNGEDKAIPRSQLHVLRESLYRGRQAADAELNLIRHRYRPEGLDQLVRHLEAPAHAGRFWGSRLLDVLDLVEFWQ
ncbi:MAG: hypothetical protein GC191_08255 [Azospirillum sp.]|nr:hypothetical protein [Azospirillum sp.]